MTLAPPIFHSHPQSSTARVSRRAIGMGVIVFFWLVVILGLFFSSYPWSQNANGLDQRGGVFAKSWLLIALWRFVIDGVVPEGAVLKPAA
jgi:hypothetical protein